MKKHLSITLVCVLAVGLWGIVQAETDPSQYQLSTDGSSIGGEVVVIRLANNSPEAITVTGVELAVTVKPAGHPEHEPFPAWGRNVLDPAAGDVILGGQPELVIEPEQTETIAVLAPGLPDTWRSHDTADHTMIITAWVEINGSFWRLDDVEHVIVPKEPLNYDLALGTNSPTGFDPSESIFLELTNNSGGTITISGDAVVQGIGHWSTQSGEERLRLPLLGGGNIEIAPGQTVPIAEIEPGPPMSWRNFYGPKIVDLKAWLLVDGAEGAGMWQSDQICHAIAGEISEDGYGGWAKYSANNEDGTATITVRVDHAQFLYGVAIVDEQCVQYDSHSIGSSVTGLSKEYFQVLQPLPSGGEEVIGHIVSVREVEPGIYNLIWSYEDGAHTVFVQFLEQGYAYYMSADYLNYPEVLHSNPLFDVEISSIKPIVPEQNPDTGKYEATLEYPTANISFSASSELNAEINVRRKGTSTNPVPPGANPTGIYLEINVVSGDLGDAEIVLEVKYSLEDIPPGMNEENLKLLRFNEDSNQWEILPDQEVDKEAKVIRVRMQGFSEFAVFELSGTELPGTGTNATMMAYVGILLVMGGIVLLRRLQQA